VASFAGSEPKTGESTTVSARLHEALAAHRLEFDAAQQEAARHLDSLNENLHRHSSSLIQTLRSRVPWLKLEAAEPAERGLYLWGGVGRGKTLLMDLFFASLDLPRTGRRAERTHFYRFMRRVHAELGRIKHRPQPLDLVAQRIAARTKILCLDEFFVADIADAMILAGLFEGLFRRGVTLVATSNLPPQDLYKDGLQRQRFLPAIELIESHVEVFHLDSGIDYRLRQLEQAPTYLDAKSALTQAGMRERFAALAQRSATGPTNLVIEGRPLRALATGSGLVWFEFGELCEGPRSQNDYIELARLYGTVFISDIPVFTPRDEDAARRFIMLIDELYDRGVKIVVSAAAPPAELYQGERLQVEFQRAASRLVEMQTQQYLAGEHRG
jgi:cell division protein ZapE